MRRFTRFAAALLTAALAATVAITAIMASPTPAAAESVSFTLEPTGITPDGNGLMNDITIPIEGGTINVSESGERMWLDHPGQSEVKITGTFDPATGRLQATYTGSHKNTREAGDIVQDVNITFTGQADTTFSTKDSQVQLFFKGTITTEITGAENNPPVQTREHSVGGVYTLTGLTTTPDLPSSANPSPAEKPVAAGGIASGTDAAKTGGFPLGTVLIGAVLVSVAGIGIGLWRSGIFGGAQAVPATALPTTPTGAPLAGPPAETDASPEEPGVEDDEEAQEEEEEEEDRVVLELTYPVGRSPKVFTHGWVFGARCVLISPDGDETDLSESVTWSGSGDFEPPAGPRSRPSFASEGANTIVLECDAAGHKAVRRFTVEAVSPSGYASVGTYASCPADAHGCIDCPHSVAGPVIAGSGLVTVNGKPAARQGDPGRHASCCGPNTFVIAGGDPEVLIEGRPAARIGDPTDHCGGIGVLDDARGSSIVRNMWEESPEAF